MQKTLLIIGAGREQIKAYEIAKQRGLYVVGTDMAEDAPAFKYSDHHLLCSTRDVDETLQEVLSFNQAHRIDGVMTIANDVPVTVAAIAKALNLAGIPVESAQAASNKVLMKEKFKEHSVPTPASIVCKSEQELLSNKSTFQYPVIVKPSDGRGSKGVLYIESENELSWAWQHAAKYSDNKIIILEQYISGPQLSVEGIMVGGIYHAVAFADRNYENLKDTKPFIVEDGGVIPSRFSDEDLEKIRVVIENGARALGINDGPLKADIVLGANGAQIIELAARLSGNYLATHHIPLAYGVDIVSATIQMALSEHVEIDLLTPRWKKYLGVRYFFPAVGKIKSIHGVESLKQDANVKFLEITKNKGDTQMEIDNHAARAGTLIYQADNYESAKMLVEQHVKNVIFELEEE